MIGELRLGLCLVRHTSIDLIRGSQLIFHFNQALCLIVNLSGSSHILLLFHTFVMKLVFNMTKNQSARVVPFRRHDSMGTFRSRPLRRRMRSDLHKTRDSPGLLISRPYFALYLKRSSHVGPTALCDFMFDCKMVDRSSPFSASSEWACSCGLNRNCRLSQNSTCTCLVMHRTLSDS